MFKSKQVLHYRIQQPLSSPCIQIKTVTRGHNYHRLILSQINTRKTLKSDNQSKRIEKTLKRCQKYKTINHQNVERIIDIFDFVENGNHFIGVIGESDRQNLFQLFSYLQTEKEDSLNLLKNVILDIAKGLEAIHKSQLIYLNLNIFNVQKKNKSQKYKLKFTHFREIDSLNGSGHRTDYYTSPEVYFQEGFTNKADIWSLAILLIQIFSRRSLHSITNFEQLPCCNLDFPSRQLLQYVPNGTIRSLLRQMLQKDPSKRPSITEVVNRIKNADFESKDLDDEEQIEEKFTLNYFKIPLFTIKSKKKKQIVLRKIIELQKQQRISVRKQYSSKNIALLIMFDEVNKKLIIKGQFKQNKELQFKKTFTMKQLSKVNPHLTQNFKTMHLLFQQIKDISSKCIDVIQTGQLKIGFSSQIIKYKVADDTLERLPPPWFQSQQKAENHQFNTNISKERNNQSQNRSSNETLTVYEQQLYEQQQHIENVKKQDDNQVMNNLVGNQYQQVINEIQQFNIMGMNYYKTRQYQKSLEQFFSAFNLSNTLPGHQFQKYINYYNISLVYYQIQQFAECNKYCLKYYYDLFRKHRGTYIEKQNKQRRFTTMFKYGLISSHLCGSEEQSKWQYKIDQRVALPESKYLKIKSYHQIMCHHHNKLKLQCQQKYLYLLLPLMDAEIQIFDEDLIIAHIETGLLVNNFLQISQSLSIFSKVTNVVIGNKREHNELFISFRQHLRAIRRSLIIKSQHQQLLIMSQWLQQYQYGEIQ